MVIDVNPTMYKPPFCDWLNVSVQNDAPTLDALESFLSDAGFGRASRPHRHGGLQWLSPTGAPVVFKEVAGNTACSVSFCGGALAYLRDAGSFLPALSHLARAPHRVSRADIALDVATDPAQHLQALSAPDLDVCLGRGSSPRRQYIGETGYTIYFGARHARIHARVYDKSAEALARRREVIPPTLRVELTFDVRVGVSLRDVAAPQALFWHYAAALLPPPPNVPSWAPVDDDNRLGIWKAPPVEPLMKARKVLDRLPLDTLRTHFAELTAPEQQYIERILLERIRPS
jgi:hypothetical protein